MTPDNTRRQFLKTSAGMALAAQLGGTVPAIATEKLATEKLATEKLVTESPALAAAREVAKNRRRRLIYNNDSGDIAHAGADTPEGFLSKRSKPILGSQVDSVFYCTGATTMFTHLAKVGETYGEFCPDGSEGAIYRKNLTALKAAGHDVLNLTVDFCHQHKLEVFFTHRINDIHDTFLDWELTRWKREHPEYLLGTREISAGAGGGNSPKYWWSSLDFEKPQVLDYLCRIEEDVCRRYDVDGVEIDYFRSPMFFRPNLDYKPATREQVEILTGFQRRIRNIAYREGNRRGRPILLAARVPATPERCLHVGIDVKQWIEEGLVDILTVSGGYAPFTEPFDEITKLAHAHKIPVYPTISGSGMRAGKGRYNTIESWRGAAANMWHAGADGIVTFNIFPAKPEQRFMEMGSPQTLAGLDKMFAIDPIRILEGDLVQAIEQRQSLPLPVPGDGKPVVTHLPIGDDLPIAGKNGTLKLAQLRVRLSTAATAATVETTLNGIALKSAQRDPSDGWITYNPLPSQYRLGKNDLSFHDTKPTADGKSGTSVTHVEVHVKYQ